jgi:hypothetical protein
MVHSVALSLEKFTPRSFVETFYFGRPQHKYLLVSIAGLIIFGFLGAIWVSVDEQLIEKQNWM